MTNSGPPLTWPQTFLTAIVLIPSLSLVPAVLLALIWLIINSAGNFYRG